MRTTYTIDNRPFYRRIKPLGCIATGAAALLFIAGLAQVCHEVGKEHDRAVAYLANRPAPMAHVTNVDGDVYVIPREDVAYYTPYTIGGTGVPATNSVIHLRGQRVIIFPGTTLEAEQAVAR